MKVRKRFLISEEELRAAEEYARVSNRTFSELVCEALRQLMHRYPRKPKNGPTANAKDLADRITALEEAIAQWYPQVPFKPISRQIMESKAAIR